MRNSESERTWWEELCEKQARMQTQATFLTSMCGPCNMEAWAPSAWAPSTATICHAMPESGVTLQVLGELSFINWHE